MDKQVGATFVNLALFDKAMAELSANAFLVLCAVNRATYEIGQLREAARISYDQFMEMTGIGSRHTVSKAIQECLDAGYLVRRDAREGKNPGFVYSLRLEDTETGRTDRR